MTKRFKVWDPNRKEMSIGMDIYMLAGWLTAKYSTEGLPNDLEILQWTGLTDKNGLDIYEGDLFKYDGKDGRIKGYVEFHENTGRFNIQRFKGDVIAYQKYGVPSYMRRHFVCGNIYQNPEMIPKI